MKNKKSLAINSLYSVLYKLLNILFPLITATYASRALLADGIGKVSLAQNAVQYFIIIAALGIPNYGIREIAKRQDDQASTDRVFSELLIINACSTTCCVIAYYTLIFCVPFFAANRLLYSITGISLLFSYFNVDWFYQGKEEYRYITARNLIVKFASFMLLFLLVHDVNDFIYYALIHSLAIAGNNIFNIINLKGKVKFTTSEIQLKRHLKPVFILLASSISIELYTLLDTTMLGAWCSDNIVGYYNNATKLARIINSTISSIALVLLPRLSYYHSSENIDELNKVAKRVLRILITLTIPAATGVYILSDSIILVLFGASFEPAILTLRILSVLVMAVAFNNFFGTQILLTFGQEKKLLISVVCGAIVNVTLNTLFIRTYAQNGAAVASVISEICVLLATFVFAKKYINFRINSRYWITLIISLVNMVASIYVIKLVNLPMFIELIAGITIGILSFGIAGILTKNEGILDILTISKGILGRINNKKIRKR